MRTCSSTQVCAAARLRCAPAEPVILGVTHFTFLFRRDTMFSHRTARSRRPQDQGAILRLEALESRWCPSCTVTVTGHTLRIIGDAANNTVAIVDNGAAGIVVTC